MSICNVSKSLVHFNVDIGQMRVVLYLMDHSLSPALNNSKKYFFYKGCYLYFYCRLNDSFVRRTFKVSQQYSTESLEVQHFQILAWPEGENPASLPGLLEVLQDPEIQYPLLIHSHNGVGRTGVMICIHCALKCVGAGGHLDLPGIVRHMRQQRGGMIQTFEQYKTCISGVLRYLQYVTGYTTMSIQDGAATSMPLLDIIHPRRSQTVTAHPLVASVAKQHAQLPRTFSDPTLQGSPQTKRRLYLQNMIPPPPTYPPPYSDDDAARAPTSPQVPVSPPPPMTPPDNELSATASGLSPIQPKEDTTTEDTITPTTSKHRMPSIVLDNGDQIEVLFDVDASILQRDTMRASQHDTTPPQLDEESQEETTEEPYLPTKTTIEEDYDDIFTKTFGSLEKLPTKKTDTSSEEVAETTTATIKKTSIEELDPLEPVNAKVSLDTEQTQSASQQSEVPEIQDTENENTEPSTTVLPTIKETQTFTADQQEQQQPELINQATEVPSTQQTEPFSHQEQQKHTSVGDTAKLFGGMKQQSKSFTNVWKRQNSIGELARKFGGTKQPSLTKHSKSFSYQPKQQTSSQAVGDLAKMFGGQDTQPPPSQPPKTSTTSPQMENQTLTFTFDDVDGEFTEMKLTRSVEKQPETNTEPTEQVPTNTRGKLPNTSAPKTEIFPKTDDSSAEFRTFTRTESTPKTFNQKQQRKVKKLDMSKFAMFGESIHD